MTALPDNPGGLIWTFHRLYPFSCAAVTCRRPGPHTKVSCETAMKVRAKAGPAQKPNINRTPYGNHQSGPQADSVNSLVASGWSTADLSLHCWSHNPSNRRVVASAGPFVGCLTASETSGSRSSDRPMPTGAPRCQPTLNLLQPRPARLRTRVGTGSAAACCSPAHWPWPWLRSASRGSRDWARC